MTEEEQDGTIPFNCPNCNELMEFEEQVRYENELYDKWICKDCSHILVLDFRGEDEEVSEWMKTND